MAHRIAWVLYYKKWPDGYIDHINHDRADNRRSNLRVVTHKENDKNKKLSSNNTSGFTGVSWHIKQKKWRVSIRANNKLIYLGMFDDFIEAIWSRMKANKKYGFHENHGRSANELLENEK